VRSNVVVVEARIASQARAPSTLRLQTAGGHRALVADPGRERTYAQKTPYRDDTTHVIFEPEDFIARLAALVPKPRAHLTRSWVYMTVAEIVDVLCATTAEVVRMDATGNS